MFPSKGLKFLNNYTAYMIANIKNIFDATNCLVQIYIYLQRSTNI